MSLIRRPQYSSGWTPASTGVLWSYHEADSYALSNGTAISGNWTDKSGNGRNLALQGSGSGLTYQTGVLNGQPVLRNAAGSARYFFPPSMLSLTECSIYIVNKVATLTTGGLFGGSNVSLSHYPYTGSDIYDSFFRSSSRMGPVHWQPPYLDTWHTYKAWSKTNDQSLYQTRNLVYHNSSNTVAPPATPQILTNGSTIMEGDIAAVYIFSAKLGSTDDAAMMDYITTRFGIDATLFQDPFNDSVVNTYGLFTRRLNDPNITITENGTEMTMTSTTNGNTIEAYETGLYDFTDKTIEIYNSSFNPSGSTFINLQDSANVKYIGLQMVYSGGGPAWYAVDGHTGTYSSNVLELCATRGAQWARYTHNSASGRIDFQVSTDGITWLVPGGPNPITSLTGFSMTSLKLNLQFSHSSADITAGRTSTFRGLRVYKY